MYKLTFLTQTLTAAFKVDLVNRKLDREKILKFLSDHQFFHKNQMNYNIVIQKTLSPYRILLTRTLDPS